MEVALSGSYAGFATALLLCLAGVLRGDASDGLILVEATGPKVGVERRQVDVK